MDDLISRQAAIDVTWFDPSYTDPLNVLTEVRDKIKVLPSAQPESLVKESRTLVKDTISRQDAIEAVAKMIATMRGGNVTWCKPIAESVISDLPSVQPERLTDDDFETIRIHLNAYKEKLCIQQRWEEADEYQRILDRFISFASAQPVAKDINVPVKDCISRQAAIDAFYEMASDIDHLCTVGDYVHVLEMLPSAQPEERTEKRTETHACDLISRQAAIECDGFREVERDDERRSN